MAKVIAAAQVAGARLRLACALAGITVRTLQRWQSDAGETGVVRGDARPTVVHPTPAHALSAAERVEILRVANEPRFAAVPPAHIASAPGEVWCWDMTFLRGPLLGQWFYLYLILDLYSRKIMGWEVQATDHSDHATHLVRRTALAEGIHAMTAKPVLHVDNGATLKATTVLAMLHWLGIKPSYSRPRVSDDNAYAESLFRTAKYRPEFPADGFPTLDAAREWATRFVHWYNVEHRRSGIRYVSPAQRHSGKDHHILAARHAVYQQAREINPRRWTRHTRDWTPIKAVTLNAERDAVIEAATASTHIDLKVA